EFGDTAKPDAGDVSADSAALQPGREEPPVYRQADETPLVPARPNAGSLDVAIIGLSGRYPQSQDIEEYWRNLRDGKDCITEVPEDRWDWRAYYSEDRSQPARHACKWGGFITDADKFDPLFFNIAPSAAEFMD